MRSKKSADLIGHIKFLPWGQLDDCSVTRPFLFCKGCGLRDQSVLKSFVQTPPSLWGDGFSVTTPNPRTSYKSVKWPIEFQSSKWEQVLQLYHSALKWCCEFILEHWPICNSSYKASAFSQDVWGLGCVLLTLSIVRGVAQATCRVS